MSAATVDIVAAVAKNGVIGRDMDLPWRLPSDLAHFKRMTLGHTLIMGRRTFLSIGKPLPGRRTIVVTRTAIDGVACAGSLDEALERATGQVFLAGGARIYADGMARAQTLHLTRVHANVDGDTRFPPIEGFVLSKVLPGEQGPKDEHAFSFETWERPGDGLGDGLGDGTGDGVS